MESNNKNQNWIFKNKDFLYGWLTGLFLKPKSETEHIDMGIVDKNMSNKTADILDEICDYEGIEYLEENYENNIDSNEIDEIIL